MKGKIHYLMLMLCLSITISSTQGQGLTEFDKSQIERRARLKMDEFEELLFLISDPTRSRGAVNRYILSSYSQEDSLFNRVFYNEDVIIEDDISKIVLTNDNIEVSALDVVTYLNNFKLQYEKNIEKTVHFTDYSFSEPVQDAYTYIVVSYTSKFNGKNINLDDYNYPAVKRKATLRTEYNFKRDAWQVWISGVNYDRDVLTSEAEELTVIEDKDLKKETIAPPPDQQEEESLPELQFTSTIPKNIKKGASLPLKWNNSVEDAEISLYQEGQEMMTLRKGLYGQQWDWNVNQKPGKNYSITLYEPATNRTVKSSSFQLKPRFPLVLKVGIPLAAIGVAVLLLNDPGPGPGPEPTQDLSEPPGLPTN
ncbi:hypothetical protein OKW21_004034 [Catalinimonas alkaloidigena]|uniref:hypothetical protein n=1 Tax=Catalinimonas alkaloidigena TaxID=1075417 RepID=UPI0024060354|nr:hypothetical protein [Catalinimonas alkaloidigena]MDF9798771.1 hypothetical protein [Catalinimonas alkaloidigena]